MDSSDASICCCAARHCALTEVNCVAAPPRQASWRPLRFVYIPLTACRMAAMDAETAAEEDWIRSEST